MTFLIVLKWIYGGFKETFISSRPCSLINLSLMVDLVGVLMEILMLGNVLLILDRLIISATWSYFCYII